jgi:uncharacterized protein YfeS
MSDHDPFNEPETTHPRAQELMHEDYFRDCVDEDAPFGSDEGWEAYYAWRDWREENPEDSIVNCLDWICCGRLQEYNSNLTEESQIREDAENPEAAFLADSNDVFTLDAAIIATCLGQLMDEGLIEFSAKPFLNVAIARQSDSLICTGPSRKAILDGIQRVADLA